MKELAETYSWYALAAKQGDTEEQKRRDDAEGNAATRVPRSTSHALSELRPLRRS